jgi:hypothetical protein
MFVFMTLVSAVIAERITVNAGFGSFPCFKR